MDEEFSSDKISLKRAFLWVFISVLAISGTATFGWLYYLHWKESLQSNPQYHIAVIAQTSPLGAHLDHHFFAEVLGLSRDHPTNLYAFNKKEGEKRLREHPLIKTATIEALPPHSLHIDYELRTPVAYIGDYVNVALDEQGVMIPFQPFFTPKKLPKLYFGFNDPAKWGHFLSDSRLQLGQKILNEFKQRGIEVKSLDLSRLEGFSYGMREIIVIVEETIEYKQVPRILRLNHKKPFQSLDAYWIYREHYIDLLPLTIDLRIKDLAFIVK